jgi:two-component system, OmpR family, response regulator PhoP
MLRFRSVANEGTPILVVEDVEETRDGIEKLLERDGYRVDSAREEEDAVVTAARKPPDLILVSLGGSLAHVIATARRVRDRAALGEQVPIVIFCVESIAEGEEVSIGNNVYLTRPDNFNQLRALLRRLLHATPPESLNARSQRRADDQIRS